MSYRYEAAPGYQATRRTKPAPASPTSSHYRPAYSAPGPSVASYVEDRSARSTRERCQVAQASTIHIQTDTRVKGVRFARPGENPSPAYLYPGGQSYVPATPVSPASAHSASPRAPSLSYSTYGEHDDLECPPTPENTPVPQPPVGSKFKHHASYTAINQFIYEMNSLVISFRCPANLEFEPMSRDQPVPKLTFASKNRPLLEQNQKLENLQSRPDAVESHGDAGVRKARKIAVGQVERALEDVKRMQAMAWNKRVYEQSKKRHT